MCAGSISSTLPDIRGDSLDGKKTTAVFMGTVRAHTLALLFLLLAISISILQAEFLPLLCSVVSIPFYLLYYFRPTQLFQESCYKVGGTLCMIAAALAVPALFAAAPLVFTATWLYFRKRYSVNYPSLIPVTGNE